MNKALLLLVLGTSGNAVAGNVDCVVGTVGPHSCKVQITIPGNTVKNAIANNQYVAIGERTEISGYGKKAAKACENSTIFYGVSGGGAMGVAWIHLTNTFGGNPCITIHYNDMKDPKASNSTPIHDMTARVQLSDIAADAQAHLKYSASY